MIRSALGVALACLLAFGWYACGGEGTPACDPGLVECWQVCVDPQADRAHCGGCGQACTDGALCEAGTCVDCSHACDSGQTRCAGSDSVQTCIADADTCLGWSPAVACDEDYSCKYGVCEPDCADECPQVDLVQCSLDGQGLQTCGDPDGDGCLEWEAPIDCGRCSVCSDGACEATCADECPGLGERQCAGPASYQECGDFDADEGWEWGPDTDCPADEICTDGACGLDTCQDECPFDGDRRCIADPEAAEACGDHDGDGCLEWGAQEACPVRCSACVAGYCESTCVDECPGLGTVECVGPTSYAECGDFDADEGWEWGPATDCGVDMLCEVDACVAAQQDQGIDIYVANDCTMDVIPTEVFVAAGRTAVLTYHNRSVDYAVDAWLSYGGGFLDLPTGQSWADPFEWCAGAAVYDGYADIDTACSSHRLMIHCQ